MKYLILIFVFLLVSCKINQTKDGVPIGKWVYISGSKNDRMLVKGKYDKFGREKGIWKYYTNDTLFRREIYFYPYSVDILYHKNGLVKELGKAYTSVKIWTKVGTWNKYNENGKLIDSITFVNE